MKWRFRSGQARLTWGSLSALVAGVPKYDAFGREIGEDTLAGLGGSPTPPQESSWEERAEREQQAFQASERAERARQEAAADAKDVAAEQAEDARQAAGTTRLDLADRHPTTPSAARSPPTQQRASEDRRRVHVRHADDRHRPPQRQRQGLPRRDRRPAPDRRRGDRRHREPRQHDRRQHERRRRASSPRPSCPSSTTGPRPTGLGEGSLMRRADVAAALRQLRSDRARSSPTCASPPSASTPRCSPARAASATSRSSPAASSSASAPTQAPASTT